MVRVARWKSVVMRWAHSDSVESFADMVPVVRLRFCAVASKLTCKASSGHSHLRVLVLLRRPVAALALSLLLNICPHVAASGAPSLNEDHIAASRLNCASNHIRLAILAVSRACDSHRHVASIVAFASLTPTYRPFRRAVQPHPVVQVIRLRTASACSPAFS